MLEKMRVALHKLFTRRREDEEAKHPRKIRALFKKMRIYYFYVFTTVNLSKGVSGQNCRMSPMSFSLLIQLCLDSQDTFCH